MTSFEAYQLFLAIKQHFTIPTYDYFKYNGKVRASANAFENRKDKYGFEKLSRLPDPKTRLLACNLSDITWINEVVSDKGAKAEASYLKKVQGLSHAFKTELNTFPRPIDQMIKLLPGQQYPLLLVMYLNQKISIQTMIVLDSILHFIPRWDLKMHDDLLWPDISSKLAKYRPFLEFDKEKFRQLAVAELINKV